MWSWFFASLETASKDKVLTLVRIPLTSEEQLQDLKNLKLDIVLAIKMKYADVIVTETELNLLRERDFRPQIIMRGDKGLLLRRSIFGKSLKLDPWYHTYEEVVAELDSLTTVYPDIARKDSIGISSQEGRVIWAFKISDNVQVEEDEPAVLYNGTHHACELLGTEVCMRLINELLSKYGKDPKVTDWINNTEIWFVPIVNPDGHHVVTSGINPRWRKNTRDNDNDGVLYEEDGDGVDLNRNYDFNWAFGGSGDPSNRRYRGPYPFSESENRAMRDFAIAQRFVFSISYHSAEEVVYYPWKWGERKAPDDKILTEIAQQIAARIKTEDGKGTYKPLYGAGTVGQSYNWFYGTLGTFDFIVEMARDLHIPPVSQAKRIIQSNLPGAYYLLERVQGPGLTGRITDAVTGDPLQAVVRIVQIDMEDIRPRRSDPVYGRYYRILAPGKYTVQVFKDGYQPKVYPDIVVSKGKMTTLDIELSPE